MDIAARLAEIRARIDGAKRRSPHAADDVTIVAVTKYGPAALVDAVAAAGLREIGESRVPDALAKAEAVTAPVRWHLIGHLQRNKAARAVRLFEVIHSVDSERLLDTLAAAAERPLDVFLQINVAGEAQKYGVRPEEALELWRRALAAPRLRVVGLMTMAPQTEDPEETRPVFRALREIRDDLARKGDGPSPSGLSMGMSADFEIAVEEGATHLRIGSVLVGRQNA